MTLVLTLTLTADFDRHIASNLTSRGVCGDVFTKERLLTDGDLAGAPGRGPSHPAAAVWLTSVFRWPAMCETECNFAGGACYTGRTSGKLVDQCCGRRSYQKLVLRCATFTSSFLCSHALR
jgi:hypothetical protein